MLLRLLLALELVFWAFFFNGFELGFLVLGRGGIFAGARMLELKEFCGAEVGLVLVCIFNPNSDD